ncbi:unnamed protein product [Ixodes pacificus]
MSDHIVPNAFLFFAPECVKACLPAKAFGSDIATMAFCYRPFFYSRARAVVTCQHCGVNQWLRTRQTQV